MRLRLLELRHLRGATDIEPRAFTAEVDLLVTRSALTAPARVRTIARMRWLGVVLLLSVGCSPDPEMCPPIHGIYQYKDQPCRLSPDTCCQGFESVWRCVDGRWRDVCYGGALAPAGILCAASRSESAKATSTWPRPPTLAPRRQTVDRRREGAQDGGHAVARSLLSPRWRGRTRWLLQECDRTGQGVRLRR